MTPKNKSPLLGRKFGLKDRFNRNRFRTLIHYICWICEDPRTLGPHRLDRVLWYSDRTAYLEMGRPITGATYVREQKGPHARSLQPMLAELEKDGVITRRIANRHSEFDLLFAVKHPEISQFSPEEISIVDAVTRVVCFDSRGTIAHQASHDCVWQAANIGEVMPYFTVFAGRPGEIVAADIDWAMRLLNPRDTAKLNDHDNESLNSTMMDSVDNLCQEAINAALWHLHRDPSIGISLPTTMASWFIYKQAGLEHLAVPDVVIVYRFDVREFLLEAIRLGDIENDIDG